MDLQWGHRCTEYAADVMKLMAKSDAVALIRFHDMFERQVKLPFKLRVLRAAKGGSDSNDAKYPKRLEHKALMYS